MIWNKGGSQVTLLRDRNPYMEAVWTAHTKHRDGCSFSSHSKLTVSVAFFFCFFLLFFHACLQ